MALYTKNRLYGPFLQHLLDLETDQSIQLWPEHSLAETAPSIEQVFSAFLPGSRSSLHWGPKGLKSPLPSFPEKRKPCPPPCPMLGDSSTPTPQTLMELSSWGTSPVKNKKEQLVRDTYHPSRPCLKAVWAGSLWKGWGWEYMTGFGSPGSPEDWDSKLVPPLDRQKRERPCGAWNWRLASFNCFESVPHLMTRLWNLSPNRGGDSLFLAALPKHLRLSRDEPSVLPGPCKFPHRLTDAHHYWGPAVVGPAAKLCHFVQRVDHQLTHVSRDSNTFLKGMAMFQTLVRLITRQPLSEHLINKGRLLIIQSNPSPFVHERVWIRVQLTGVVQIPFLLMGLSFTSYLNIPVTQLLRIVKKCLQVLSVKGLHRVNWWWGSGYTSTWNTHLVLVMNSFRNGLADLRPDSLIEFHIRIRVWGRG